MYPEANSKTSMRMHWEISKNVAFGLRQCMPNPSSSQVKLPGPLPSPPDIKVCDMQVMHISL
jgi:hypothetical protein